MSQIVIINFYKKLMPGKNKGGGSGPPAAKEEKPAKIVD